MSSFRCRARLIGYSVAMLGLLTAHVGAAHAEVGSKWLVLTSGGITRTSEELPAALEAALEAGKEVLLTTVLGIKVEKTCTAVTLIGVKIEGESTISNGGKLKFTGCKLILNGQAAPECEVHSVGLPVGTVESNSLRGDIGLHYLKNEKGEYIRNEKGEIILHAPIRLEPQTGEVFVNINLGEECPIGENIPISGIIYAKDCENHLETHLVKRLVEEGPGSTVWVLNKTEEHKVTLDGSLLMFLAGAHTGLKWAGMIG